MWEKTIGYSKRKLYVAHLKKKKSPRTKKLTRPWKYSVEPSAVIYFRFFRFPNTSGHVQNTKSHSLRAEKYDSKGEKIRRIPQEVMISGQIQKNPYFVIKCEHDKMNVKCQNEYEMNMEMTLSITNKLVGNMFHENKCFFYMSGCA